MLLCSVKQRLSRRTLRSAMFVDVHFRTASRRTAPAVTQIKWCRSRKDVQRGSGWGEKGEINIIVWPSTHTEPCATTGMLNIKANDHRFNALV